MDKLFEKKYSIVYADPPWQYFNGSVSRGGVDHKYSVMTIEELQNIPVKEFTNDDALLFLWVTFPKLEESFAIFHAWGFQYKTLGFSWIKTYKNGKPFFGIGYYTRSNCEICLLGIKGNGHKLIKSKYVSSVVVSEKREHSRKPDIIRNKIVELCGDIPRIELFARNKSNGWDCWGNEVSKFETNDLENITS